MNAAETQTQVGTNDATLGRLEVTPGTLTPEFWGTRRNFAVVLPPYESSVQLVVQPTHAQASVMVAGQPCTLNEPVALPLDHGLNRFAIDVTSADGSAQQQYEVKVTRGHAVPDWECVASAAAFEPRDSAGQVVFKGYMWILGGYLPHLVADVWRSRDGLNWEKTADIPEPSGINIPMVFVHAGKMWVSGNTGRLWSSEDGVAWSLACEAPPWAGRYAAGCAVFRNRMWVLGGARRNDVWSSADGVNWQQETPSAAWSPRQLFGNVVVHENRLWVIGGGIANYQPFRAYRDVWSSRDGRHWELVTDEAPWPARIWSDCVSYRNRLWLIGGYRAQPTHNNFDDVWYSADGREWKQLTTPRCWSPRHEISPYVFDDALWVVAGNAWPLLNDAWRLRLSGLQFTSQPVVEEYVGHQYRYRAQADFNLSAKPVRYTLEAGPSWMAIDAATGLIRGVPPTLGEYEVSVSATDDHERAVQQYTLRVIDL